jgi:cysteinyl-tRNA synthetase
MQAHYSSVLDLSNDALLASEKGHKRLMDAINILDKLKTSETTSFDINAWTQKCYNALNDDFNTPILIANLFDVVKFINQINDGKATISETDLALLKTSLNAFAFDVLGLINETVTNDNSETLSGTIELLIKLRAEAKANKDYALSDQIRDELLALGVQLKDGREGTSFSIN